MTKLHTPNLIVAKTIAKTLKNELSIPHKKFVELFYETRKNGPKPLQMNNFYFSGTINPSNLLTQNYQNIINYLIERNLMTSNDINGFRIFVATKKLVHSDFNNLWK